MSSSRDHAPTTGAARPRALPPEAEQSGWVKTVLANVREEIRAEVAYALELAAAEPSGWQPIESAPAGKWVLGYRGEPLLIFPISWHPTSHPAGLWRDRNGAYWPVTHWMPLPAPPQSNGEGC